MKLFLPPSLPALRPVRQWDPGWAGGAGSPWHSWWERVFAWRQCRLRRVPGQCCAGSPRPASGLPVHFPLDLGPILAARHALVNEACSVPSQLLRPGLSKQVCGMWQCTPRRLVGAASSLKPRSGKAVSGPTPCLLWLILLTIPAPQQLGAGLPPHCIMAGVSWDAHPALSPSAGC